MSTESSINIPRLTDKTLVAAFREVSRTYGLAGFSATAMAGVSLSNLPDDKDQESIEPWASILKQNSSLLTTMHLRTGGVSIAFHRGTRAKNSGVFDEIVITYRPENGAVSEADRIQITALIAKRLKAFDPTRSLQGHATDENNHLEALHQSTLERLEQLAEDIIRRTTDTHSRLEEEYFAKKLSIEQELARVKSDLSAAHHAEIASLAVKEEALLRRESEIDNRDNTHVRREMRNKMLEDVKRRIQDFGVSRRTEDKRKPVSIGLIALLLCLSLLIGQSLWEIQSFHNLVSSVKGMKAIDGTDFVQDRTALYLVWGRLSMLTAGLFFTALYYVRWQNRWAEQHSLAEFQLQQFYIDVNRANWVIESGLEWRKETSTEIPEAILASVTRNLFRVQDEPPPALHPADELASALLGSASKLKLKNGESEVEFDKPGKIPNEKR